MNNSYFSEAWFYEKFNLPEADIEVDDREYSVSVDVAASEEDRSIGKVPVDTMELQFIVEMPQLTPSVILMNAEETDDIFDDLADQAALSALKRIFAERFDSGLYSYWYYGLDRDEPGYRQLTDDERAKVERYIAHRAQFGPLCKNAQDAICTIENCCKVFIEQLDTSEEDTPLLAAHLNCLMELKKEIIHNGLPTIHEVEMFYEITMNRLEVSVQLCHARVSYSMHKKLGIFEDGTSNYGSSIIPYRTKLYTVKYPMLSCASFARIHNVDQATVRQWIRRSKLRTVCKAGRDWLIPATTALPPKGFTPGKYTIDNRPPDEALAQFPFLGQILPGASISVEKGGPGKFFVLKNGFNIKGVPETSVQAVMAQDEREKFEYLLFEADWATYDLDEKILKTVVAKSE